MKRIIDSTLVILSLMLIFGCKESKVGQGNPTKDSMSIDTDSVISGKVFTKQDIVSEDTLNAVIRTQSPKSKDFDFEVFIMRGEKTVQIIPFSYPKDDTFDHFIALIFLYKINITYAFSFSCKNIINSHCTIVCYKPYSSNNSSNTSY